MTILGIFLPTLTVTFAFTDDYPVLAITNGLGPSEWFGSSIVNTTASGGRPFAGLLDQLVFSTVPADSSWTKRGAPAGMRRASTSRAR